MKIPTQNNTYILGNDLFAMQLNQQISKLYADVFLPLFIRGFLLF